MSGNLHFTDHANKVHLDVRKFSGIIMRTFQTRDPTLMRTLWTSVIQPRIDYCSQLWFPCKAGEIQKLEVLLRSFTSKIADISHLPPWERLKHLRLSSIERRMERYVVIYTWKILENLVPNTGISSHTSPRHGRLCSLPKIVTKCSKAIQTIRENSLNVKGPRLFNTIPEEIRNLSGCSVTTFKTHLDKYLDTIPDQPRLPGYTSQCEAETNSILHMRKLRVGQTS